MNDIWFTSDTHFYHKKILEFCPHTRKGGDIEEMNELIVSAWNSRVKPGDRIYHLGDFSFGKPWVTNDLAARLNGSKHLVEGNHDGSNMLKYIGHHFESVSDYKSIRVGDLTFVLMHFPIESWDRMSHGSIHLHGHLHGDDHHTCRVLKNRMDVGVDCRKEKDMAPFHIDEVLAIIKQRNDLLADVEENSDYLG